MTGAQKGGHQLPLGITLMPVGVPGGELHGRVPLHHFVEHLHSRWFTVDIRGLPRDSYMADHLSSEHSELTLAQELSQQRRRRTRSGSTAGGKGVGGAAQAWHKRRAQRRNQSCHCFFTLPPIQKGRN